MLDVKKVLKDGIPEFAPVVMWYPSDIITHEELTFQLENFKKAGIEEFFVHPSYGMRIPYLGEEFFDMVKHLVKEAKRLGMKYWIYDEYNWPSGVAGGYITRDMSWTRMTLAAMLKFDVGPGEKIRYELPPKQISNISLLQACIIEDGSVRNVFPEVDDNILSWKNDKNEAETLYVFFSIWAAGPHAYSRWSEYAVKQDYYLDTLDDEAVMEFIKATHEKYKEVVGEYFGTVVKGVFTDEVAALYDVSYLKGAVYLPWSRKLEEKFLEINGYDVKTILPELFIDLGEKRTARARYDYWITVKKLYMSAYMKQTYDWCCENNLIYTGHGGGEESLRYQLTSFTDMYEMCEYFSMPGIDTIFSHVYINDYDFNVTPKLLASASHFLGRKLMLSETYTGSGWDMTMGDMKRIANRLLLYGINRLQFMGAFYSLNNFRKTFPMGYPPSHNWNNVLFKHYDHFNKYVSAMSWLNANTEICARALMLNPCACARALAGGPKLRAGGEHLGPFNIHPLKNLDLTAQGIVNALTDLNIPFEIVFEQVLDKAEVKDGRININGLSYDTFILPVARYVTASTYKILSELARQGGRVVFVNGLPEVDIDKNEPVSVDELLTLENVRVVNCEDYDIIGANTKARAGAFTFAVKESLRGLEPYIADIEYTEGIMSSIRRNGDDYYIIIINDANSKRPVHGKIYLDKPIAVFDPENGDLKRAKIERMDNYAEFAMELEAFEAAVIVISDEIQKTMKIQKAERICACAPVKEETLTQFKLKPCGKNYFVPAAYLVAEDGLAKCVGLHLRRPNVTDSIGWVIPNGAKYDPTNVTTVYDFEIDSLPDSVELISESEFPTAWFVNGVPVSKPSFERIWDRANTVFEIASLLKKGKNRLTSVVKFTDYEAPYAAPPAVLRGDFRVFNNAITLAEAGTKADYWNDQGYSYYAGDLVYETFFTFDGKGSISLEIDTSDVAEVFVNGISAGRRLWKPYEFYLDGLCEKGENKLEIKITSTYANLFYRPTPSGLKAARLKFCK